MILKNVYFWHTKVVGTHPGLCIYLKYKNFLTVSLHYYVVQLHALSLFSPLDFPIKLKPICSPWITVERLVYDLYTNFILGPRGDTYNKNKIQLLNVFIQKTQLCQLKFVSQRKKHLKVIYWLKTVWWEVQSLKKNFPLRLSCFLNNCLSQLYNTEDSTSMLQICILIQNMLCAVWVYYQH